MCCCVYLQELRRQLDKQAAESSSALTAERLEAARKAEGSAAAAAEAAQAAAASALHAAEVRVALLEGQLEVLEQERDLLQQQVWACRGQMKQAGRIDRRAVVLLAPATALNA